LVEPFVKMAFKSAFLICCLFVSSYGNGEIISIDAAEDFFLSGLDLGPPPHQQVAKMARYIVHYSGERFLYFHIHVLMLT